MEAAYKPLASRWPYASEEILTPEGKPFEVASYSRDIASKDWGIYYYVPRPGSVYLEHLLASECRAMDACGIDGMYWDEFSWVAQSRGYSRYDYSRWDGHSADLDEQGNVIRLKCDNGWITETAQLVLAEECLRRGKILVANEAASLRSVNSLPIARFQEEHNGYGYMANAHLSPVPLIFGNSYTFEHEDIWGHKTRKDIFDSVKSVLSLGCIYSPLYNDNLLLEGEGPDNFVCKLYPLTIRDLGPGTVTGEERLITTQGGSFNWPGRAASVRLYIYDEKGDLAGKDTVLKTEAGKPLALTVPKDGLVIAEVEMSAPGARAGDQPVNLIKNGDAETGTLDNWIGFSKVSSDGPHSGKFCFLAQGKALAMCNEFIPVEPARTYTLTAWIKSLGKGENRALVGYAPFDAAKNPIQPQEVEVTLGSETKLFEACTAADKVIKITDGSQWQATENNCIAFKADDSGKYADLPNRNLSTSFGVVKVENKGAYWEVQLKNACGQNYPAGTKVREHASANGYIYNAFVGPVPTEWTQCTGVIKRMAASGTPTDQWWHGTKYVKVILLLNFGQDPNCSTAVDDVSVTASAK
jgi:hypothetical protein